MRGILLASAVLLFATEAAGCQCGARPSLQESLEATAIFEGTIVDKRVVFATYYDEIFPAVEYEFAVSRSWKGVSSRRVWLLGGYSNCATHFWGNERYLVFASPHWEKPGALSSSICSRTRSIAAAGDDLRELGEPRMSFRDQINPPRSLPTSRMVRAYAITGITGLMSVRERPVAAVDYLGVAPLASGAMSICALLAIGLLFRTNRTGALLAAQSAS